MNKQFQNGRWAFTLDDGTVISDRAFHLLCPFVANGFVFYGKTIPGQNFGVARNLSTGVEIANPQAGPWIIWATDGRYVVGANRLHQGKQFHELDARVMIFDTQTAQWLDFAALGRPTLDIFRQVGSGQQPTALWLHNGNQVDGFNGTDPQGVVRRISWASPTLADFVIEAKNAVSGVTSALIRIQRTFVLATGEMGPNMVVENWPFDANAPTIPTWLYSI